jgi:hypothetical protein
MTVLGFLVGLSSLVVSLAGREAVLQRLGLSPPLPYFTQDSALQGKGVDPVISIALKSVRSASAVWIPFDNRGLRLDQGWRDVRTKDHRLIIVIAPQQSSGAMIRHYLMIPPKNGN